ncbi:hypothetical protein [Paracoccus sp. SY]|uniref:hypothetical protein n=1 Tax=Paracoccus sp. SY TaxID=1330255 RepID=UPI0011AFC7DA|nr:hypothetical protein [Paracoccus sp. SY]
MAQAEYSGMSAAIQGNTVSRRRLLAASPAACLMAAVGGAYIAGAEAAGATEAETRTPLEALFDRWLVLDAEERRIYAESDDEDEHGDATDRKIEVENQMRAAPKLKITDVALMILASTDYGLFGLSDEWREQFRDEARVLIAA